MTEADFYHLSDNERIFVRADIPDNPRAILIIIHGMVEHSRRYIDFMKHLEHENIAVYAPDYRGHGKTAGSEDNAGHMDNYEHILNDFREIERSIRSKHPGKPVFIMGHSFGSVLSRCYISANKGHAGLILSGNVKRPGIDEYGGRALSSVMKAMLGKKHRSRLLWNVLFKGYNKHFKDARTMFDWLSRDEARVDDYVNDPYCGNVFTVSYMLNVLNCLFRANNENTVINTEKLPVLMICGKDDPVGKFCDEPKKLAEAYRENGSAVTEKYYESGRHEMLNETNRNDVFKEISDWILSLS